MKIVNGTNPTEKVVSARIPTPCFNSASKAMRGASDHKSQLTLFG
jgi:hypothetical protein